MAYQIEWDMGNVLELNEKYEEEFKDYIMSHRYIDRMYYLLGDFKSWVWVGGCHPKHISILNKTEQYFHEYFKGKRDPPEYQVECLCGHPIIENCWIYNKELDKVETVGNCCIRRCKGTNDGENKNGKTKMCRNCNNPHKNKKTIYCNDCKDKCCLSCGEVTKGYMYCYKCFINKD